MLCCTSLGGCDDFSKGMWMLKRRFLCLGSEFR
jgi:hypothetical protein